LNTATEIRREVLGEQHPDLAASFYNRAVLYISTGRRDEALDMMRRSSEIFDHVVGQVVSIGSESQRMA